MSVSSVTTPGTISPELAALLFPQPSTWRGRLWNRALDVFFPAHCAACDSPLKTGTLFCEACAGRVKWIGGDRCRRCGAATGAGSGAVDDCPECRTAPPAYVTASCAAGGFKGGPLRDAILALKFGRRHHLAKPLGDVLALRMRATALCDAEALLLPVPLAKKATPAEAVNHAELLAECISASVGARVEPGLLRKVRPTKPQATLKRKERRTNLSGAFACEEKVLERCRGHTLVLVDDVMTTGSTLSECARTLHAVGLGPVRAAVVARA